MAEGEICLFASCRLVILCWLLIHPTGQNRGLELLLGRIHALLACLSGSAVADGPQWELAELDRGIVQGTPENAQCTKRHNVSVRKYTDTPHSQSPSLSSLASSDHQLCRKSPITQTDYVKHWPLS